MDEGAAALARRAQRFGKAPAATTNADEAEEIDEEARLSELMQLRTAERKEAEQHGILSSGKTRLEEAKDLVGTCPGMISEYQYYWRKLRYNNIHSLEKDEQGRPQWYLTIKDYARSAAGNEQELPSDVRSPEVLLRTTDYILCHLLTTQPFTAVNQAFIRDRARAIVKDFTMQHVRNAPAIEAHERIVRMAALSMHIFRDKRQPDGPFDHDGERKQFVNALSSLTQFYDDSRSPSLPKTFISPTHISPHEPEFTAYWHLFSLRRPPAMPAIEAESGFSDLASNDNSVYPNAVLFHPLFRLARTFVTLWAQSEQLVAAAENMLISPKERAAKEAREASRGVHRFKRAAMDEEHMNGAGAQAEDENNWRPQRFEYPPGFVFPAMALLRRLADPGVPWVLAAVLEASALDDIRARALWEIWQMRQGGDILVSELVDQLGCDDPEDVRAIVDAVAEASGRAVRKLRPKGSTEIKAYRLVGSMKFPSHFPRARRSTRLIDSKRPAHMQLADAVNQPWDPSTNGYELTVQEVPELIFPGRVDIEDTDATKPAPNKSTLANTRSLSGLESSRGGTPFNGFENGANGGVFAGFGAVGKANPFGAAASSTNPIASTNGGAVKSDPFRETTSASNPFAGTSSSTNPFGGTTTTSNPFATAPSTTAVASSSTPFSASFNSNTTASASNAFGAKPVTGPFGLGSTATGGNTTNGFGAGASAFGVGSGAFGSKPNAVAPGTSATPKSAPPQQAKTGIPPSTKLSPFAPSFVPKFGSFSSGPSISAPQLPNPDAESLSPEASFIPTHESVHQDGSAAETAKAAREARLRDKLEAARKEEAQLRAEEERRAEERSKQEEARQKEEEARRRQAEAERQLLEAQRQQEQAQRERAWIEQEQAMAEATRQRREQLHANTAQLLLGDIIEILVVPEVKYAVQREKGNRWLVRNAFAWWKTRTTKRAKRRQVLENMGLGRVGIAGAVEEAGELFDEDDEKDGGAVVHERHRTTSFREDRNDTELAIAMAKATAERERLWAPGVFFDIATQTLTNIAKQQHKTLDDVPAWDIWLCTSGANKSSAEWLRKKFNARPTQLVDGTVSVASITPRNDQKESAPGLVIFECSPHLGAAMNEAEWSDAWSNEANRIARLFSAMSNHSSYSPSLLFIVWSTDHVAQYTEVISRKIKKAASHLADVSVQGEPGVAVLVDDTAEEAFREALNSLELDVEGRSLVEQSSVTESLSKQISIWHRTLSHVVSRVPTFDDEDNAPHIAQIIFALLRAFDFMATSILRLSAPQFKDVTYLPEFNAGAAIDTKTLYNLADTYAASLDFAEAVDLNVLRSTLRQHRHSSKPFPARFFCERLAQLVDITLTPLVSGNRPYPEVYATEKAFETMLNDAVAALDARSRKRVPDDSPVRDNKKARLISTENQSKPNRTEHAETETESSGATKLRALLDRTRNRWANET